MDLFEDEASGSILDDDTYTSRSSFEYFALRELVRSRPSSPFPLSFTTPHPNLARSPLDTDESKNDKNSEHDDESDFQPYEDAPQDGKDNNDREKELGKAERFGESEGEEDDALSALRRTNAVSRDETAGNNLETERLKVILEKPVGGAVKALPLTPPAPSNLAMPPLPNIAPQGSIHRMPGGRLGYSPNQPYHIPPWSGGKVGMSSPLGSSSVAPGLRSPSSQFRSTPPSTLTGAFSPNCFRPDNDAKIHLPTFETDESPPQNEYDHSEWRDTTSSTTTREASEPIIPDGLLARFDQLRRENERLKKHVARSQTFKIFYVVKGKFYLNEPQWQWGEKGPVLSVTNPISRVEHYVIQHPEVAFAFNKFYSYASPKDRKALETEEGIFRAPKSFKEELVLISEDVKGAVMAFVKRVPNFNKLFPRFNVSRPIPAPYLFMYSAESFVDEVKQAMDPTSRGLIELLRASIHKSHGAEYASARAHFRKGLISKNLLKYLFRPGEILVSPDGPSTQAFKALDWAVEITPPKDEDAEKVSPPKDEDAEKVSPLKDEDAEDGNQIKGTRGNRKKTAQKSRAGRPTNESNLAVESGECRWDIPVCSWVYNGVFRMQYSTVKVRMQVVNAEGSVRIQSLNIYPLQYGPTELRTRLETRGHTFWKIRFQRLVSYVSPDSLSDDVEERYMIDTNTYKQLHPESQLSLLLTADISKAEMQNDSLPLKSSLLLFPPRIVGYNLMRKKWVDLNVDWIREVSWNKQAFRDLVVGEETKELVEALVMKQLAAARSTDTIQGKGNGLIMLLHGGPGTGKTFTAEGVAEFAEKPLLRVTCGDIGTTAELVEGKLRSIFYLGKIWDCVVLLDEADVFLEERDTKDLNRNALVSVFLRELEYYEGILILTSNRVGSFDEAFRSRIQLPLHYENLGVSQRRKIWRNFVERLKTVDEANVDYEDIKDHLDELAMEEMNGREIRNAITIGRQLAQFKKKTLCYSHLRHVITVSGKFGKYLQELRLYTDDEDKREKGLR